jgi:hypothetical protein
LPRTRCRRMAQRGHGSSKSARLPNGENHASSRCNDVPQA